MNVDKTSIYMQRAMELAFLGKGFVSPNPMVGCVIVHEDKIIGEDDQKRFQDEIQKVTDKYVADVDKIAQDKEKDIMTL